MEICGALVHNAAPTAATYDWVCQNTTIFEIQMVMRVILYFFFYFKQFFFSFTFSRFDRQGSFWIRYAVFFSPFFFCFISCISGVFDVRLLQMNEHWTKAGRFSLFFFYCFRCCSFLLRVRIISKPWCFFGQLFCLGPCDTVCVSMCALLLFFFFSFSVFFFSRFVLFVHK